MKLFDNALYVYFVGMGILSANPEENPYLFNANIV